jgi:SulP family sulfate permease
MLSSLADGIGATNTATLAIGAAALAWLAWSRAKLSGVLRRVGLVRTAAQALSKAAPIVAVVAGIAAVSGLNLT